MSTKRSLALAVALLLASIAGCASSDSTDLPTEPDPASSAATAGGGGSTPDNGHQATGSGQDAGSSAFQSEGGACGNQADQQGCSCTVGTPDRTCTPSGGGCASGTQKCTATKQGEISSGTWGTCTCGCVAGSKTFTNPGTENFTVPVYGSLTIELWGGGSGGVAYSPADKATAGGDSSFNSAVKAGGGTPDGKGGIASGGTTNTPGGNAPGIGGGDSPKGGAGGKQSHVLDGCASMPNGSPAGDGENGHAPGGGGQGDVTCQLDWMNFQGWGEYGTGGGAGAYASKTYKPGELTAGASVPVVIGAGGHGSKGAPSSEAPGTGRNPGYYTAGDGAAGQVSITWTCN